jgi:hypothetical protein
MLHLVNDIPYVRTLCNELLDNVGDDWTDALVEVTEGWDDMPPVCLTCLKRAKRIVLAENTDTSWRHERAMEAGMLHGIDAYNAMME